MLEQVYCWSRLEEPVPGFEIPDYWMEDDGMRKYGKLKLLYNSSKYGARPVWKERRALKERTVCGRGHLAPK